MLQHSSKAVVPHNGYHDAAFETSWRLRTFGILVERYQLVLCTFLTALALGLALVSLVALPQQADLPIRPLVGDSSRYIALNSVLSHGSEENGAPQFVVSVRRPEVRLDRPSPTTIDERLLFDTFIHHLRAATVRDGFDLIEPERELANRNGYSEVVETSPWLVQLRTTDPQAMRRYAIDALEEANISTRDTVERFVLAMRDAQEKRLDRARIDLLDRIDRTAEAAGLHLDQRLLFLEEQLRIARRLGTAMEGRNRADITSLANARVDVAAEGHLAYYLRGVEDIDAEVESLKLRGIAKDPLRFSSAASTLRTQLVRLEGDQSLAHLDAALALSPLADVGRFASAAYNIDQMRFEYVIPIPLILAMFGFAGLVIGIVAALGTDAWHRSQARLRI